MYSIHVFFNTINIIVIHYTSGVREKLSKERVDLSLNSYMIIREYGLGHSHYVLKVQPR